MGTSYGTNLNMSYYICCSQQRAFLKLFQDPFLKLLLRDIRISNELQKYMTRLTQSRTS